MQYKRLIAKLALSVPSVVPTLIRARCRSVGKQIDDLPFAFVAPLGAYSTMIFDIQSKQQIVNSTQGTAGHIDHADPHTSASLQQEATESGCLLFAVCSWLGSGRAGYVFSQSFGDGFFGGGPTHFIFSAAFEKNQRRNTFDSIALGYSRVFVNVNFYHAGIPRKLFATQPP